MYPIKKKKKEAATTTEAGIPFTKKVKSEDFGTATTGKLGSDVGSATLVASKLKAARKGVTAAEQEKAPEKPASKSREKYIERMKKRVK